MAIYSDFLLVYPDPAKHKVVELFESSAHRNNVYTSVPMRSRHNKLGYIWIGSQHGIPVALISFALMSFC
jgi:hypothetical protein